MYLQYYMIWFLNVILVSLNIANWALRKKFNIPEKIGDTFNAGGALFSTSLVVLLAILLL